MTPRPNPPCPLAHAGCTSVTSVRWGALIWLWIIQNSFSFIGLSKLLHLQSYSMYMYIMIHNILIYIYYTYYTQTYIVIDDIILWMSWSPQNETMYLFGEKHRLLYAKLLNQLQSGQSPLGAIIATVGFCICDISHRLVITGVGSSWLPSTWFTNPCGWETQLLAPSPFGGFLK